MKRRAKLRKRYAALREEGTISNKRIAKNTIVLYLRMLLVMAIGLYTSRVVVKALGVADYGLYNVVGAVVAMFAFLNGTLATASSRFITVEMGKGTPGSLKRVFSTILNVHILLALLTVLALEVAGPFVLRSKLNIDPSRMGAVVWSFQCVVVTTFFSITQVPYSAALIAHERMSAFAYMSIFDVLAKLAIAFGVMAASFDKLKTYALLMALASVVSILLYRFYCTYYFPEARWRKVFDRKLLKPVFSFAGWQVFATILVMLMTQGLTLVNQRFFGEKLVAAGALALTVQGHIMALVANFKTAAVPQIVKAYSSGQKEVSKVLLRETTVLSVFLVLILGAPFFVYAHEIIHLWLGHVPAYTPEILRLLVVAALFSVLDTSFYIILYANGNLRPNALMNLVLIGTVFCCTVGAVVIVRNPLTAFVALLVNSILLGAFGKPLLLHWMEGYRWRDFQPIFLQTLKSVCCAVLVSVVIARLLPRSVPGVLAGSALIASLLASMIFFFVITPAQRIKVRELFKKMLGKIRS